MTLKFSTFVGTHITAVLPELAQLCTTVFREWPHLYDGDGSYDEAHFQTLISSPKAAVFIAYDDDLPVGASTCIPLEDATTNVQAPFLERHWPLTRFFYFAESVLLPAHRGHGIGSTFFAMREAHARAVSNCDFACFCSVERPENHPLKPAERASNDAFWRRQGYVPLPDLRCTMIWKEMGNTAESQISLLFWMKPLTSVPKTFLS